MISFKREKDNQLSNFTIKQEKFLEKIEESKELDNKFLIDLNSKKSLKMNTISTLVESFDCDNSNNLSLRCSQWQRRLDQYFVSSAIDNDARQTATLFLLGGARLFEIHDTLPVEIPIADTESVGNTEYKKAVYRLNKYFNPKKNKVIEQFKFSQARQERYEAIDQYVTRLRVLAKFCEFHSTYHEIVRQVIQTCE